MKKPAAQALRKSKRRWRSRTWGKGWKALAPAIFKVGSPSMLKKNRVGKPICLKLPPKFKPSKCETVASCSCSEVWVGPKEAGEAGRGERVGKPWPMRFSGLEALVCSGTIGYSKPF